MSEQITSGCVSCAEALPARARFCFACGAAQAGPQCASCGEELVPGARFCFACGAPTSQSTAPSGQVTRRVTTVLFADLVGFTTLSETRDQEDVRELLSQYFEASRRVVSRYGGTVEKFIGDAVMAVWGVATAHEDDAERAVRAGLELVDATASLGEARGIPGLSMRVGVVTGEVAVTVGATQEGMVAGDAVNTAARVQSAASPGQVWVDETTRLLTASAITYVDVGSHLLKGKADPVPLWSVRAVVASVGGAQRADGLEAPLVGRDRQLRLTKDLFHATQDSARPLLLVVEGEPGVGKTRLAWEFEKYTDGLTGRVLWHRGRCLSYGEGVSFYALAEAIRGRLQTAEDDVGSDEDGPGRPEAEATVLLRGLERLVPDESEREWLQPRVGALLGIESVGSFSREDLFSAWTTLLERAGEGDPVVLLIDDAQHADEGLLQFVEHLLVAGDFACFVVLLTRPGLLEQRPALALNRRASVVHLEALAPAEMGELLEGLVAGLPKEVRIQLVERAEGIPLYAVETVRSLVDRDLVVPRGGQYVLNADAGLDLSGLQAPVSLQALVAARLDALSADQRLVVDRASVVGESFAGETVAALCEDVDELPAVLASLLRQQILSQETRRFSAEFGHYRFVQSVVRQVAYARLSRRDRKLLHLAVVAQMEQASDTADVSAVVAQHYLDAAAAVPRDSDAEQLRSSAVTHLEQAAARAVALGAAGEAAGHLGVALSLVSEPARVAALEAGLAAALQNAGRYEESCRHAERAEELLVGLADRVGAAGAAVTRARSLVGLREHDRSLAVSLPWWEELKSHVGDEDVRYQLCSAVLAAQHRKGISDWPIVEAHMVLAEHSEDERLITDSYSSLAISMSTIGALRVSRVLLEASADLARRNHDQGVLARTLNNLAADHTLVDLGLAIEAAREGSEVAARAGLSQWRSFNDVNLMMSLFARGEWAELDTILLDAERQPFDANVQLWVILHRLLARVRLVDEPPLLIADGREIEIGDDFADLAFSHLVAALTAERDGDIRAASRQAARAVALQHEVNGLWDDLHFVWPVAADLALAADDEDALAAMIEMVTRTDLAGVPRSLRAHHARTAGLLAHRSGDGAEAERLLRSAVDEFARWGSVPYGARAQLDLAAVLDADGRTDEAATVRAPAVTELERLAARRWLAEAGVQPVPAPSS